MILYFVIESAFHNITQICVYLRAFHLRKSAGDSLYFSRRFAQILYFVIESTFHNITQICVYLRVFHLRKSAGDSLYFSRRFSQIFSQIFADFR